MYTNKTLTIIDTFGFLFRSYYALPPLKSKTGFPTGMITGFMNFIAGIGKDFQTDYIIFALDSKGDTFRNEIYSEYKDHRPEAPDDLKAQLPIVIDMIEKMGFKTASKIGFEADDIIASLSNDAKDKGLSVRVVSHDKDLYQLIEENIFMFDAIKRKIVTEEDCFTKYGVYPHQFTDYQSLLGDSADNVPGVKGVGAKTAMSLIQSYNDLDNIYKNINDIEKTRWKTLLRDGKELAYISKQLVTLDKECLTLDELSFLDNLILPLENPILKIANILRDFDLHSIVNRVQKEGTSYKTIVPTEYVEVQNAKPAIDANVKYILLNDEKELIKIVSDIPKDSIVAFDTETTGLDSLTEKIVGFSFCVDITKAYYVPIDHFYLGVPEQITKDVAIKAINILNKHRLVLQNFKYDYEIIKFNFGIELELYADTMIMAWLIQSDKPVGMDKLALKYFDHKTIAFKDMVKKGEDFSNVVLEEATKYASEDAFITRILYDKLLEELEKEEGMVKLAEELEYPFIKVLSNLQQNGIKIDTSVLEDLKQISKKYVDELTQEIYRLSDKTFNINSPKQLGEVLFEHLKLPVGKKTKTGYSTNEQVLLKLLDSHEVIQKLLDYREAFKLQSTYIEPLLKLAKNKDDNRIHTSFLQTGTATGRLSSKNPNLQNIPVRSEAGRQIRESFVSKDGFKLVSIDYSQIELRLLAHFSKDKALVYAFNSGADIHLQTAIHIFGEEEAESKRNIAKSINFGLLYGMGARKLGETLGIPAKEAKIYIDKYFESFSTIKEFLASIEASALENDYVKTLFNRKRKFDFGNAAPMLKAGYLREAVNAVFQGSASDLIKLAMLKIYDKYKNSDEVKMLLQIHDELIFEVKEDIVDEVAIDLADIMKNIYKLNIPLEVSVSIGNNWAELK
ncbi:MAG: DNA polymerase I [Arcobacteraceae bacterium]|nr:DNA polymerase I [Arcobacteraceae bacterium]